MLLVEATLVGAEQPFWILIVLYLQSRHRVPEKAVHLFYTEDLIITDSGVPMNVPMPVNGTYTGVHVHVHVQCLP